MRQFLAFSLLMFTACVVGEEGPEARLDAGSLAPADDAGTEDPAAPDAAVEEAACLPPAAVAPNGNHNAGLACLSCHTGTGAPRWTLAGTLYASAAGGTPIGNATIVIVDNNGVEHSLATASNGNFYTNQALAFPVSVKASKCPDEKAMTGKPAVGDCNGCHTANAAQGRIHLP